MTSACIHGFAPGTCLICQTLNPKDGTTEKSARETVAVLPAAQPATQPAARPSRSPARARSGPRVVPKEAPRTTSGLLKLFGLLVAVIAVIVVAWTVLHVVFAVLHIVELIGVALVCSYLGWVAGVHHGHRQARREDAARR